MNIYGMSVQTRKKRNIFLLLTQFFFAQSGKTDVDKIHPTPCACYLSTSISWWTSNEHSLSATHQLLHPYIIPKKYGLFPCYMWINGGPGPRRPPQLPGSCWAPAPRQGQELLLPWSAPDLQGFRCRTDKTRAVGGKTRERVSSYREPS